VELMGGRITLDSEVGKGTTFRFWLPIEAVADSGAPPTHITPEIAERADVVHGSLGRILLAEDSQANQLVATAILRKAGYAVDLARDGREAVALARSTPYDLVLMDVQMPVLDGYQATAAIRAMPDAAGKVPILAMTAAAMPGDRDRCLDAGMDAHLPKPMSRQTLLAAVAEALAQRPRRRRPLSAPDPGARPVLLDRETLEELRAAVGPGRLPRLIAVFAEETRARLKRILGAATSGDLSAVEHDAHALKSAAGTFGSAALRDRAATLEGACRRLDAGAVRTAVSDLGAMVEASLAAMPMAAAAPAAGS
jgi:hypothetical protein